MDRSQLANDPQEALRIALDGQQAGIWTAFPAIVLSVNWTELTIEAQPAVQGSTVDDAGNKQYVDLPVLADVPLVFPAAGGFALTLPIAAGDEVLIVIASRCIDSWWQNGSHGNIPMETRMHDLSDGFAIPAQMSQARIQTLSYAPSQTAARITKVDGSAYLEIDSSGKVTVQAPGGMSVQGDVTVTGKVTATDEVTAKSAGANVKLSTHVHSGVTSGPNNSGPPV